MFFRVIQADMLLITRIFTLRSQLAKYTPVLHEKTSNKIYVQVYHYVITLSLFQIREIIMNLRLHGLWKTTKDGTCAKTIFVVVNDLKYGRHLVFCYKLQSSYVSFNSITILVLKRINILAQ